LQLPSNPLVHLVYEDAGHSFDEAQDDDGADWEARQSAQQETLAFLATWLED
jgi:dienelactone hydrolase